MVANNLRQKQLLRNKFLAHENRPLFAKKAIESLEEVLALERVFKLRKAKSRFLPHLLASLLVLKRASCNRFALVAALLAHLTSVK